MFQLLTAALGNRNSVVMRYFLYAVPVCVERAPQKLALVLVKSSSAPLTDSGNARQTVCHLLRLTQMS